MTKSPWASAPMAGLLWSSEAAAFTGNSAASGDEPVASKRRA
jgi:hypothetical protein